MRQRLATDGPGFGPLLRAARLRFEWLPRIQRFVRIAVPVQGADRFTVELLRVTDLLRSRVAERGGRGNYFVGWSAKEELVRHIEALPLRDEAQEFFLDEDGNPA